MREIKFRVWDLKNLFWFDPKKFNLLGEPMFIPNYYQEFKIQQFTGLLDKNGVEIYDGDIGCYEIGTSDFSFYAPQDDCVIYFRDEDRSYSWAIRSKKGGFDWNLNSKFASKSFKVTGNIFENPELI